MIRLTPRVRPIVLGATPAADLGFLLFLAFAVAGMFSAMRGIGARLEPPAYTAASPAESTAVFVGVAADGSAKVNGRPVSASDLAGEVEKALARDPAAVCVLHVAPEASYQEGVHVLSLLLQGEDGAPPTAGHRLSLPTQRQVESFVSAAGYDPFETERP